MESAVECRAKYEEAVNQMADLVTLTKSENRDLTDDEINRYDKAEAEAEEWKTLAEKRERIEKFETRNREDRNKFKSEVIHTTRRSKLYGAEQRADAMRAWTLYGTPRYKPNYGNAAEDIGFDFRTNQITLTLSNRGGKDLDLRQLKDEIEERTQVIGTPSLGGYIVPQDNSMLYSFEEALKEYGGITENCSVIRTEDGGAHPIATTDDTGNSGEIITEGLTNNFTDVTIGKKDLPVFAYRVGTKATWETMTDAAQDPAVWIGKALGTRTARKWARDASIGAGTTEPFGMGTQATWSNAASSTLAYADFCTLEANLDPAYQKNAKIFCNSGRKKDIRNILDGADRPIWQPQAQSGLSGPTPMSILEYPLVLCQEVPTGYFYFGDASYYFWRIVREVTITKLVERYAELGMVAFLCFSRAGGVLADPATNSGVHPMLFMSANGGSAQP